jgi:hypothetical protein
MSKTLYVVQEGKSNEEVAKAIPAVLHSNPTATVAELAEAVGAPEHQIQHVLDAYVPSGEKIGPGQGGGWLADDVAVNSGARIERPAPQELGYRWPDGSHREIPFDEKDAEHREEMGLDALEGGDDS